MRPALLLAVLAAVACGKKRQEPKKREPVALRDDCGELRYGSGERWCPDDREAKLACFVAAARACHPSRIRIVQPTEEGAPIVEDLRVDASCAVLSRRDTSADGWAAPNAPRITERTCRGVAIEQAACGALTLTQCS